ncbi:hypothetical protein [Massilia sp. ZL223]|uniref:hypothetical protein n=1 Tax=Massilia sp. ZL223 TaxID=2824904 RepID=UPI001B8311DA|nr:hypothetical protein [Massilia sp. ZL223]MBQ5961600.1 hypothetical protein [Massilia sp. ZL223]
MRHLLSSFFSFIRRYVLLFIGIVLMLLCGRWIHDEWRQVRSFIDELPLLERAELNVNLYKSTLSSTIVLEAQRLATMPLDRLEAEIRSLDSVILRLEQTQDDLSIVSVLRSGMDAMPARLERAALHGIELDLRRQERAYLAASRARLDVVVHREKARRNLENLRLAYLRAFTEQEEAKSKLRRALADRRWIDRVYSGSAVNTLVREREAEVSTLKTRADAALARFRKQKQLVDQLPQAPAIAQPLIDEQRLIAAATPLHQRAARARTLAARSIAWQAYQAVKPVLGTAVWLLVAWLVVPFSIRAVFYFLLAPLAARARPIVIARKQESEAFSFGSPDPIDGGGPLISAVSKRVVLAPGDEMMIRPAYCQSQPEHVDVKTKVLFDWSYWLPSIAARLWMLNRLSTHRPADIVISSTVNALEEVALLEIPAGASFVLQVRGMIGVVYQRGRRPKIRSHWKLRTLHAWMTLQLRYLSFEGPCTLIVKGCRGVRLENVGTGRMISQDATLGFSANTVYSTVRMKPFIPYILGRRALLNDKFAGENAYCLYEEIPRGGGPIYQNRNSLEALFDAGLKAFGI